MPDYKKMYLHLFRETERAISILIDAQRQCEEIYVSSPEPEIMLLPRIKEESEDEPD